MKCANMLYDIEEETALNGFGAFLEAQGYKDLLSFWRGNLKTMRKLVKQGRDTIWIFILKNYYRPAYLHRRPFDFVAGNPPWLSYRYILEPEYQEQVKRMFFLYHLIGKKEARLFTQMDLATLFYVFSADSYLKKGGTIAFVMPRSVLTGAKQHKHFQEFLQGYELPPTRLKKVLDMGKVTPIFKVPTCVLISSTFGKQDKVTKATFTGKIPGKNLKLKNVESELKRFNEDLAAYNLFPPQMTPSLYLKHIKAGANIYPRSFWFVQPIKSPFGFNKEKPALETDPEVMKTAKKPWQNIQIKGEIEAEYLYSTLPSNQMLPFGYINLKLIIIPTEKKPSGLVMVNRDRSLNKGHSGLQDWLSQVEKLWSTVKKKGNKATIYDWLDYGNKLTSQYTTGCYNVVYSRLGTNIASAVIMHSNTTILSGIVPCGYINEWTNYHYQTTDEHEAHYLCAFLNAPSVDDAIKDYQTKGQFGERDISRTPFEVVNIPKFDVNDQRHIKLAEISKICHHKVLMLKQEGHNIGQLRSKVRKELAQELAAIDVSVKDIL